MTLPVFFNPKQVALNSSSFSPSAAKPQQVLDDWQRRGFDIEVHDFQPVSRDTLALAHDRAYVYSVLDGHAENGFGNTDPEVAASLPYTTGSMLAAAEHAVLYNTHACSLTSGFHHAGYNFGGGFCTFNGLMVTALKLKQDGLIRTVGILDCDAHYGNGTQDIINHLDLGWVKHYSMGRHFHTAADAGRTGRKFLDWLEDAIDDLRDCSLILYQAGADPHKQDPLGGILGEKAMYERDIMVAGGLSRRPLAWNLAGGYQRSPLDGSIRPVLDLHRATADAWGASPN